MATIVHSDSERMSGTPVGVSVTAGIDYSATYIVRDNITLFLFQYLDVRFRELRGTMESVHLTLQGVCV